MKIFVINLDRRQDRWALARKHLDDREINFTRFVGIDYKPGWVGCRESHLYIMELCSGEDVFMILEDDVEFIYNYSFIAVAMTQLPEDWDCLYIGASPQEPQQKYSNCLYKLNNAKTTHAIIWHNREGGAVEYILKHKDEIRKLDDYFAHTIQPRFNCFVIHPMVATQRQSQSDTCKRADTSTILANYTKYCP